jgi:predicted RNase H-like HicB family nuclease
MTEFPHYHINLFWHASSGTWVADIPDLQGCSAHGPTPADALREAEIATDLWLEVAREHGDPIPAPRYRPAIYAARAA